MLILNKDIASAVQGNLSSNKGFIFNINGIKSKVIRKYLTPPSIQNYLL